MLARPTSNVSLEGVSLAFSVCENEWWTFMFVCKMVSILIYDPILQHSPIYRFSRVCLLTSFSEFGNKDNSEATFIIPDVKNLSTSRACNLDIMFISCGTVHFLYEFLKNLTFLCFSLNYLFQRASRTKYWWRKFLWKPYGRLFSPE